MRKTFVAFLLLVLASCGNDKLPTNVMDKNKMTAVMWDMLRAGEFVSSYVAYKDTGTNRFAATNAIYQQLYTIHKITEDQFKTSWKYYQEHPTDMKAILDSLSKKTLADVRTDSTKKKAIDSLSTAPSTMIPDSNHSKQIMLDSLRKLRLQVEQPR